MFTMARIIYGIVVLGLICAGCAFSQIKAARDPEFSNILSITKNNPDPALKILPVTGYDRTSLISNLAKTRKAYILCVPVTQGSESCDARVFIKDAGTG